uniref:Fibrinogen C-terminal domain-containing protein n=1 Tax=Monopterus albus TaxID=43700 RepID=A0A3Q3IFA9_MONAL
QQRTVNKDKTHKMEQQSVTERTCKDFEIRSQVSGSKSTGRSSRSSASAAATKAKAKAEVALVQAKYAAKEAAMMKEKAQIEAEACSQELLNGALQSGEVDIYPQGKEGQSVRVYCDMETDGGGWTVFQRRMSGKTDFYRTWNEYSVGFGNLSEEFWLGNKLLHNLTSTGPVSLRVDMQSGNDTAYAHYANFSIDSEERHYTLTVSGFTGTAGDSMRYHNGRPFSTHDKDPDPLGIHCARAYMGGWWYKNCYKTNLNGLYGINNWKGKDSSIPFTEMKFRPSRFSPPYI